MHAKLPFFKFKPLYSNPHPTTYTTPMHSTPPKSHLSLSPSLKTMMPSFSTISLLLLPFSLILLIFLFIYPNDLHLQRTLTSSCPHSSSAAASLNFTGLLTPHIDFSLLIGILTLPSNYERRHLLRNVYSLQPLPPAALIHVKFVFCNLTDDTTRTLIALEIMQYDDIIILNCTENMNNGKTYTYFSSLPSILDQPYDYIMKADDDIYFRLPRLVESLRFRPKEDFYYGFVIPCDSMDPFHDYMSGMGYLLSWDLVTWISMSAIAKGEQEGAEDMMTGKWLREGEKGKNRINTKPAMYDYPIPVPIDTCSHEFVPDTIAVHRLKDHGKWARMLSYFNVTKGLKPSKLYHL